MTEFNNVTVVKNANIYFEGKVTSRTVKFSDNSEKTLGVMLPGEYDFNTEKKEIMEILSGKLEVLLPQENNWKEISANESFEVPEKSKFKIKIHQITDYCCSYVD